MLAREISELFVRDATRLVQEIEAFPDDETLWRVAPGITNSPGNLALHLEGNLREFIGRQIGNVDYTRERDLEFSSRNIPRAEMLKRLRAVVEMLGNVLPGLSSEVLDGPHPHKPMGVEMSSRQFLIHLYGHLSYHLGQIDYARRLFTGAGALDLTQLQK